ITIQLPPLRERRADVQPLAQHFVRRAAEGYHVEVESITPRAMEWLKSQSWPGNIRQLRQLIERAVLIRGGPELDVDDFTAVHDTATTESRDALPEVGAMTLDDIERAMIEKAMRHYDGNISRVADALGVSRAALYRRLEKYGLS